MDSPAAMIAKKYVNAADTGIISRNDLFKLPKLVNVSNWKLVEIVGSINFAQKAPAVHYYGILVKNQGGLYYVSQAVTDQLAKIDRRFKKIRREIKVK